MFFMCFSSVFATASVFFPALSEEIIILFPSSESLIPAALNSLLLAALPHFSERVFTCSCAETFSGSSIIFSNFFMFPQVPKFNKHTPGAFPRSRAFSPLCALSLPKALKQISIQRPLQADSASHISQTRPFLLHISALSPCTHLFSRAAKSCKPRSSRHQHTHSRLCTSSSAEGAGLPQAACLRALQCIPSSPLHHGSLCLSEHSSVGPKSFFSLLSVFPESHLVRALLEAAPAYPNVIFLHQPLVIPADFAGSLVFLSKVNFLSHLISTPKLFFMKSIASFFAMMWFFVILCFPRFLLFIL